MIIAVFICMIRALFIILLVLQPLGLLYGEVGEAGVTLPILDYVAGARAMGLGAAYTALSDEITSIYWNPAGLARLYKQQVYAMYEKLYESSTYWFGGYALPFYGIGVFGVGMIFLSTGDIVGTGPMQEDLGVYSDTQSMVIISYGAPLNTIRALSSRHLRFLDLGVSMKLLKHSLADYSSYGIAFDIGARFIPIKTSAVLKDFIFGLVLQNILPPSNRLEREREWYPLRLKAGVCYRTLYDTLLVNLDFSQVFFRKQSPELNVGLEYFMLRYFRIRTGYRRGVSAGMGLEIEDFSFDYALNYNFDLGLIHQFSASFRFGSLRR